MTVDQALELLEENTLRRAEKDTPESRHIEQELLTFLYEETNDVQYLHMLLVHLKEIDIHRYQEALQKTIAEGYDCNWYDYGKLLESGDLGYTDEEEAFRCYERAADSQPRGDGSAIAPLTDNRGFARLRMAEMCKDGIGTPKDIERSRKLIEEVDKDCQSSEFKPEQNMILLAKADLALEDNDPLQALELLAECREQAADMLDDFYYREGLEELFAINDRLYQLIEPDLYDLDIYDLSEILKEPHKVKVRTEDREFLITSLPEEGTMVYSLDDQWFRTLPDLFEAKIGDDLQFSELREEILDVEVLA
ncbi:MAG: hypothetical protein IKE21_07645 [Erysipelotrichaceae bacterium]|nr:hypothetical protein [Erysipelotrichaceae bacterium]